MITLSGLQRNNEIWFQDSNGNEGVWIVDAKNGDGNVEFGGTGKADVTLTLSDDDLVKVLATIKRHF